MRPASSKAAPSSAGSALHTRRLAWLGLPDTRWGWAVLGLTVCALAGYAFMQVVTTPFSHDEHQFVASAALVADGLVPYRDFPLLHMPYLPYLDALAMLVMSSPTMAARLVSGLASFGSLLMVTTLAWAAWGHEPWWQRYLAGVGAVTAVGLSPLYLETSGQAWNHDIPVFLVGLACLAFLWRSRAGEPRGRPFLSGAMLGLAAGVRLTFMVSVVPLLAAVWLLEPERRAAARQSAGLLLGFAFALIPAAATFLLAPRAFIFGNLIYPRLNTIYRRALEHGEAMDLPGKLRYVAEVVAPAPIHLIVAIAAIGTLVIVIQRQRLEPTLASRISLLSFGVAASLFVGSLAPTPSWYQYYYAPWPFLTLAVVSGTACFPWRRLRSRMSMTWVPILMVAGLPAVWPVLSDRGSALVEGRWIPQQIHQAGLRMARRVPLAGAVLTLAPILPLEGGLKIYPEFADGPFTWRVAELLSPEVAESYGILHPQALDRLVAERPPHALLTGAERGHEGFVGGQPFGLEQPLIDYAAARGLLAEKVPTPFLERDLTLWR